MHPTLGILFNVLYLLLSIPQTPLSGIIPPQLGELDALEQLNLGNNRIEGKLSRSLLRSAIEEILLVYLVYK